MHPDLYMKIDELPPAQKFMYEYGCFTSFWSSLDILLDVAICKFSGQDPKTYCLSRSLTSGQKKVELEKYIADPIILGKLQVVFDTAERNDWMHGHILNPNGDFSKLTRLRINTKSGAVTNETINFSVSPFEGFYKAFEEFRSVIGITVAECNDYIEKIQA